MGDNIKNVSSVLLRTKAARQGGLIWVQTNPVPDIPQCSAPALHGCCATSKNLTGQVRQMNQRAWALLQPLGFKQVDMFKAAEAHCGQVETWSSDSCPLFSNMSAVCNVHPTPVGGQVLGEALTTAVIASAGNNLEYHV